MQTNWSTRANIHLGYNICTYRNIFSYELTVDPQETVTAVASIAATPGIDRRFDPLLYCFDYAVTDLDAYSDEYLSAGKLPINVKVYSKEFVYPASSLETAPLETAQSGYILNPEYLFHNDHTQVCKFYICASDELKLYNGISLSDMINSFISKNMRFLICLAVELLLFITFTVLFIVFRRKNNV